MKKIITMCAVLLMTVSVFSQAPEKMSYQAVVRDGNDLLVISTTVGMQISILQGSVNGTAVYVETHTPTSNANGLVSVEIGAGIIQSGDFTAIDWTDGPYFIKTETDPTGGTTYSITGTSQLLSVPYALHANTVENDQDGNKILSFSKETNVSQSYVMMDTIAIKAGKVVTIKGYVQTTGSECTVYLYDLTNEEWVNALHPLWTIYEDEGIGFASFIGENGAVVPFSTSKKEFTTYFQPTSDFLLEVRAKELTATSENGVGEATVIVIQ